MTRLKSRHNSSSLSCMTPRIAARVLAATLAGAALFVSASALADYSACMTFCLDEHNFSYCHPICDGRASNAGTTGDAGDTDGMESIAPDTAPCGTVDEQHDVIWMWLTKIYGPVFMAVIPVDPEEDRRFFSKEDGGASKTDLNVSFSKYNTNERCTVTLRIDDACRYMVTEKAECTIQGE